MRMTTHSETRTLPYTARQMYELVADVPEYPGFLPWCSAARILGVTRCGERDVMDAELVISFKAFRERFRSRVTLWPEAGKIHTEYIDGPFRRMRSTWAFRDLKDGCEVEFFVDFEFRNALLRSLIGLVFEEAMRRVVQAFERRAKELNG